MLFSIVLCCPLTAKISAASTTDEYKIKAALIYKLTRFVEWPEIEDIQQNNPFNICILGRDDFDASIDALKNLKVNSRLINILRIKQSRNVRDTCQLVFISESKQAFMKEILDALVQYPVLTISDTEGFAEKGGMIQLTHGEKRMGFMINLKRAHKAGLKISAPLLGLATIVDTSVAGETP